MSMIGTVVRRAGQRWWVRVLNRAGKWVGQVVDTSADAPESRFKPKRDLYSKMSTAEVQAADEEDSHDHGHSH